MSADAQRLLFAAPTIDEAWLRAFDEALRATPSWLEDCGRAVEIAYQTDAGARDGYSRVGWALHRLGRAQEALDYFERDWSLGRMRRWQFVRYIETLVALDRIQIAEDRVKAYYSDHPDARDGWAAIARHHLRRDAVELAREFFSRDHALDRLSPLYVLSLAQLEARAGRMSEAESLVARAYAAGGGLRDGYAGLANLEGEAEAARALFARDHELKRLTPRNLVTLAELTTRCGRVEEAEKLVAEAYATDASIQDGYARISDHLGASNTSAAVRALLARDEREKRLTPPRMARLALLTAELPTKGMEAIRLAEAAVALDPRQASVLETLGDSFYERGDRARALGLYRGAARAKRLHATHWGRLATSLIAQATTSAAAAEAVAEAEEVLTTYDRADPGLLDPSGVLARALWRGGFASEAVTLLRRRAEAEPLSAATALLSAEYHLKHGQTNAAEQLAEAAIRRDAGLRIKWVQTLSRTRAEPIADMESLIGAVLRRVETNRDTWESYMRSNAGRIGRDSTFLCRHLQVDDHVIDVGCSPPLLLALLHRAGFRRLTAVDPAIDAFQAFLESEGIAGHLTPVSALPVSGLEASADLVCFCEVLEHLPMDVLQVLEGLHQMLRPGGHLYVTTPNLRSISGLYALLRRKSGLASKPEESVRDQYVRARSEWRYFGHVREYTAHEVVRVVESCGFRHVTSEYHPVRFVRGRTSRLVFLLERLYVRWRLFGAHLFIKT